MYSLDFLLYATHGSKLMDLFFPFKVITNLVALLLHKCGIMDNF